MAGQRQPRNHVLSLDGNGSHVRLPSGIFNHLTEATVEGWVRWESFGNWSRFLDFGKQHQSMVVAHRGNTPDLTFYIYDANHQKHAISTPSFLQRNQWCHIAAISGGSGMKLYVNGALVGEHDYTGSFAAIDSGDNNYLGRSNWPANQDFHGQMDEVRVWSVERTQEQIQASMHQALTGSQKGLIGYWSFEDTEELLTDVSGNRYHGVLEGNAQRVPVALPTHVPQPCVLSGRVQNCEGEPIRSARVRLLQDGNLIQQTSSNVAGVYRLALLTPGNVDVQAISTTQGIWRENQQLQAGQHTLDLTLVDAVHIEGTALMLDDTTPHVGLVVQAVSMDDSGSCAEPHVAATVLTNEQGKYQLVNLRPGWYRLRCYTPGTYVNYTSGGRANSSNGEPVLFQVGADSQYHNVNWRLPRFKQGTWRHFDSASGLVSMAVQTIHEDTEGFLWFGGGSWNANGQGVSRYDGQCFAPWTVADGLQSNTVLAIHQSHDGALWFGTGRGQGDGKGVSRYQDSTLTHFGMEDGLAHNTVIAIDQDTSGMLWFGTDGGGVSCYDGSVFVNYQVEDGLAANGVGAIHETRDGTLWFATDGGISRFDGEHFTNYTTENGLAGNTVYAIHEAKDGVLWLATDGGISRFDGERFTNLTVRDGLGDRCVYSMTEARDGKLWFGTVRGLSCYDGLGFVNYLSAEMQSGKISLVYALHEDQAGNLWVGTALAGVYQLVPPSFKTFTRADGLSHDLVQQSYQDTDGTFWFATDRGVSHVDGQQVSYLTVEDGLVHPFVGSIERDAQGAFWFGTGGWWVPAGGVSRYDGDHITNYTEGDGLTHNRIFDIHCDRQGTLWFGTGGGLSVYDGKQFRRLSGDGGPTSDDSVFSIHEASDGSLWFGTWLGGVYRYDGERFTTHLTTEQGLVNNFVRAVYQDSTGVWWFGTFNGLSRYDGSGFTNFTVGNGLTGNEVSSICEDGDGILWFGSWGGGVMGYDGETWTTLDREDGLSHNYVLAIDPAQDGSLLISTQQGVTQYHRNRVPPRSQIISVTIQGDTYTPPESLPTMVTGTRVTFTCNAIDFRTRPEKRQYRYRVVPLGTDRQKQPGSHPRFLAPTHASLFDWVPERAGKYRFEVQCIDRDLNYSEPVGVVLEVIPDPRDQQITELESALERRNWELESLNAELRAELQDARAMQMSLMPERAPDIAGVEMAGKCVTANTVGGDFFSYLPGRSNREVGLVIADVAGHAMKGAMNAVMTDGILSMAHQNQRRFHPDMLLEEVNDVLARRLERDMNVTMVIGLLDTQTMTLTLANAAHHAYPVLVRDGEVTELKSRGLPLGMRAGVEYREEVFDLQSGDILVLMTDGIIEASRSGSRFAQVDQELMYGESGRLEQVLTGFTSDMTAEAMVTALIQDAIEYGGGERTDDATVVIAKMDS